MPKPVSFSKESIIASALEILRSEGPEALSARRLCKAVGCSVSPLFTAYNNMAEIMADARIAAEKLFMDYVADVNEYNPAFKEFGMRLVRFSKEEPILFHYLFLDKNEKSDVADEKASECLKGIEGAFQISSEKAMLLYRHMWPFALGVAMLSNKYPEVYTEDHVSEMLSTQFAAMISLIKSGREVINLTPHHNTEEK